jgi:hypothetical protein
VSQRFWQWSSAQAVASEASPEKARLAERNSPREMNRHEFLWATTQFATHGKTVLVRDAVDERS